MTRYLPIFSLLPLPLPSQTILTQLLEFSELCLVISPPPHTFSFCLFYPCHINNEIQIILHVWASMSPPHLWQSLMDIQSLYTDICSEFFYEYDISVNGYHHIDKIRVAIFNLSSKTTAKHCNWTFWLLLMRLLSSDLFFLLVSSCINLENCKNY